MAPAIQNFDTKIRSLTAKNTLPKTKITLLKPKLRSQKPRLRSWNVQDYAPENLNYAPKKPRLRSWNLNYAPKNQDYAPYNLNYAPKNQDYALRKIFPAIELPNCQLSTRMIWVTVHKWFVSVKHGILDKRHLNHCDTITPNTDVQMGIVRIETRMLRLYMTLTKKGTEIENVELTFVCLIHVLTNSTQLYCILLSSHRNLIFFPNHRFFFYFYLKWNKIQILFHIF